MIILLASGDYYVGLFFPLTVMCVLPCVHVHKSEVDIYVLEVVYFLCFMFSFVIFSC